MSAATVSQRLDSRDGRVNLFPVAATTKILAGILLALDGNHRLVQASDAASRRVVGVSEDEVDNSAGAAGDLNAKAKKGCFLLGNSVANAVTRAHIGLSCWVEDNQTVASVVGTNSVVAGIVEDVTSEGVWVWVGLPTTRMPQAVTLTSTNGTAAAASANLANLAAETEKIGDDVRAMHAALVAQGLLKAA